MTRSARSASRREDLGSPLRAAVGLADLVRAWGALPSQMRREGMVEMAEQLGYEWTPAPASTSESKPAGAAPFRVRPSARSKASFAPIPFWRIESADFFGKLPVPEEVKPLGRAAFERKRSGRLPAQPDPEPLAPWSRLWPTLFRGLAAQRTSAALDVNGLVQRWSQGRTVTRLPYRSSLTWPTRLVVVVDRGRHLIPFRSDQRMVVRRLRRLLPRRGLQLRVLSDGPEGLAIDPKANAYASIEEPDAPVLALTDLGAYAGAEVRTSWLRLGRELHRRRTQRLALLPVPVLRWPRTLARLWHASPWERGAAATDAPAADPSEARDGRAAALLRLLAVLPRVETWMLREVRRLLPRREADVGTEADAFLHPWIDHAQAAGFRVSGEAAEELVAGLESEPWKLRRRFAALLLRAQPSMAPELWHATVLALDSADSALVAAELGEHLARAREFFLSFASSLAHSSTPAQDRGDMVSFFHRLEERTPALVDEHQELARVRRTITGEAEPPPPAASRRFTFAQLGSRLVLPTEHAESGGLQRGSSPLCELESTTGQVNVRCAGSSVVLSHEQGSEPAFAPERLSLVTDRMRARGFVFRRPRWASAVGRDRYGLWAEFRVGSTAQRMRWIPPGRFWMGSPEDEPGRYEDEGPRHLVSLSHGFWLGEVPCTQALWEAVMGENPSQIPGPSRPVESVDFTAVEAFLDALGLKAPGLEPRLPVEAEWEYACRAGHEHGPYAGEIDLRGENDAPGLDEVAWYGGNSGVDGDVAGAVDSRGWPEKQHAHEHAASHPVGCKTPNRWGLRDMLGNVWEWCLDSPRDYAENVLVNPPELGPKRAVRGGSWPSDARRVRPAARRAFHREFAYVYLGFRLARGQGALVGRSAPAEPVPAEREPRRARRGTRGQASGGEA